MRVFVLVAIRRDPHVSYPPSVWHIQRRVRRHHARSFRATSAAFLPLRDELFRSLHRVTLKSFAAKPAAPTDVLLPTFWFFSALLDVAGNEDEAELILMILGDLCRAWPGAAAHAEVVRRTTPDSVPLPPPMSTGRTLDLLHYVEREDTLLVLLAHALESDEHTQLSFLSRWGVDAAWDYTEALLGRCWQGESGNVTILPKDVRTVVTDFLLHELSIAWLDGVNVAAYPVSADVDALFEAASWQPIVDPGLTASLDLLWNSQLVPQRLYDGAFHRAVVAVPPAVALFLSRLPSGLLHDCLLFHIHDRPLWSLPWPSSSKRGPRDAGADPVVVPSACPDRFDSPYASAEKQANRFKEESDVAVEESQRLADVFNDYDLLLSNRGAVRVPLPPMSRYVFGQLLCQCRLPATLLAPFVHRHSGAMAEGSDAQTQYRVAFTEAELVLGITVTSAVQRWTMALREQNAPPLRSMWQDRSSRNCRSDAYRQWVCKRMKHAQRKVAALLSMAHGTDGGHGVELGLLSKAQRQQALSVLEQRLFVPLPLTFRGSSTTWIQDAVREVGEEYAQVPETLLKKGEAASADVADEPLATPQSNEWSDVKDEEDEEDDSSSGESSNGKPTRGEMNALSREVCELESMMVRRGRQASESSEDYEAQVSYEAPANLDAYPGRKDMPEVAHNEVFLNNVRLFAAELASES